MMDLITVNISDMKITKDQKTLVTYALGSCVGICLFDAAARIGALGHIMLPKKENDAGDNKYKFGDSCVDSMIKEMEKAGCLKRRISAKIAGGAQMFKTVCDQSAQSIGDRNIAAVKDALRLNGIPVIAEDTGKNYGRTLYFNTSDGSVTVKSFVNGVTIL